MSEKFRLEHSPIYYILAGLLIVLTISLGYFTNRSQFLLLLTQYSVFFGIYIYTFYLAKKNEDLITFFVSTAILLRFILIFSIPNFSDDIYRFIWDGRLLTNGYNPFDHLPSYYIENNIDIAGINQELFQLLNSPEYFTIYPPIAQLNFAVSTWIFPDSIWGASILMKVFLFCCEISSIGLIFRLLRYFQLPTENVLLYALNPLIILEIMGNLHFEGAMIMFLLGAIWLLVMHKALLVSAITFALSIASKLLPLMFLPLLISRLGWRRSISYFTIIGGVLLLLFIPLFSGVFINNFGNSLNLYFQKFEFNASVYYIARWIGYQYKGYNIIQDLGPALAMGTAIGILLMTALEKIPRDSVLVWKGLLTKMLFSITLYLAFTTIVHPWYVALPIVLCLFTPYRYPIVWSGLAFLTYINYSYETYYENLGMVALEYGVVGAVMVYELYQYEGQLWRAKTEQ